MATKKEDKPKSKGTGNRTKDEAALAAKDPVQQPEQKPEPGAPASFPIVGIGASAGGLAAFEAFFSGMPAVSDSGMAFVLVQHLKQIVKTGQTMRREGLKIKANGETTTAVLTAHSISQGPTPYADTPLCLVIIQETPEPDPRQGAAAFQAAVAGDASKEERIRELEQLLQAKEEYLQATSEELETSNEELKSSNEEMQSVNEELQSTNEELETSKEELQSVNEELATVNAELENKVAELTRANNDMNNLLAGTGIATVFMDLNLHILRFTPEATKLINLISSDIGRPIAHIVSNLVGAEQLVPEAQAVLDTLVPHESDVQTLSGSWFRMRIQPYRTLENVIEGVVLTFVDITENKAAQAVTGRDK